MSTEADERYDIAFAGECLGGYDPAAVREALGQLFKADAQTLERLFSGKRQRIKRDCDKATALKYQQSLARAGAKAIVTRAGTDATASSPAQSATDESVRKTGSANAAGVGAAVASLEVLPGGSDILRPDERRSDAALDVDLSHLSVAETGERLSDETDAPLPKVNAPALDIAEPGAQLGPDRAQDAVEIPETLSLDLAPIGTDLLEGGADPGKSAPISTDHLTLSDPGSDLLSESERRTDEAEAPDTSHLTLDQPANPFTQS